MVAASKLRRAQERVQQARPYAAQMLRVLNSLASRVDPAAHPLLDERKTPRADHKAFLIVVTADRGLCGSFNTNVIKASAAFITDHRERQVGDHVPEVRDPQDRPVVREDVVARTLPDGRQRGEQDRSRRGDEGEEDDTPGPRDAAESAEGERHLLRR